MGFVELSNGHILNLDIISTITDNGSGRKIIIFKEEGILELNDEDFVLIKSALIENGLLYSEGAN